MKKKSTTKLYYLLLVLCLFSTSCGDSDDSGKGKTGDNSMIVGTWIDATYREIAIYTFLENGTGFRKLVDSYDNSSKVDAFYYKFNAKAMTIEFDDDFTGLNYYTECCGIISSVWTIDIKAGLKMTLTNTYITQLGRPNSVTGECEDVTTQEHERKWILLKQTDL